MNRTFKWAAAAAASVCLVSGAAMAQQQGARPQGAPQGGPPPGAQGGPPPGGGGPGGPGARPPQPTPNENPEPPPAVNFVSAVLTGAAVGSGGDMNAMGAFNARVEAEAGKMCYWLNAQHIAVPTTATLNRGAARAAGQPVVTLRPPLGSIAQHCVMIPEALAHQIADNPEQFYVTIGDQERPTGAIRGQLVAGNG